jgi:hypothetical protein
MARAEQRGLPCGMPSNPGLDLQPLSMAPRGPAIAWLQAAGCLAAAAARAGYARQKRAPACAGEEEDRRYSSWIAQGDHLAGVSCQFPGQIEFEKYHLQRRNFDLDETRKFVDADRCGTES